MIFSEYRKITGRTMSDTGSKITDSCHMSLGLNTEIMGELPDAIAAEDVVNFKEEVGDAFWYLANYCNMWNIDPVMQIILGADDKGIMPLDKTNGQQYMLVFGMGQSVALLQDLDKKHLAYGKEGDHEKRIAYINDIYTVLEYFCHLIGADTNDIRANNIEKLVSRYPDLRFDADRASNRSAEHLQAERDILERGPLQEVSEEQ